MMKQASEYESAGMFKDAAALYYKAYLKKSDKPEIRIALKRTAQLALEDMGRNVSEAYSRGDYKKTVYEYVEAMGFKDRMESAGITLNTDPALKRQYADAKNRYLDDRYNDGLRYLDEKNYDEAKTVFSEIHNIDPAYKDTKSYLDQATYEPVYREAADLFADDKFMQSYAKWKWIADRDPQYRDVHDRMQQALHERYREGSLMLMNEEFDGAATALGEVYHADPDFEDVKAQYTEARNEPVYRQAKNDLSQGKCRTAYYAFDDVIRDAGSYKDCRTLRDEALDCAAYPVAIHTPVFRNYNAEAIEFENTLIKKLVNLNDPFLKVYDLSSIDSRLDRAIADRQGNIDRTALNELSANHGIKAVLLLDFSSFSKSGGKMKRTEKTGFERELVKTSSGESSYRDKKVNYVQYSQENAVELSVSFRLVSTQTGQILLSDDYSGDESDEVNFARYDGNPRSLYPSVKINNTLSVDENGYNRLQSLLRGSDRITPVDQLQKLLFDDLTSEISNDIQHFNPEK